MTANSLLQRRMGMIKVVLFVVCLLPLVRLIVLGFTDGLGANPIEFITRSTGTWTLTFLLVTLSITPLRKILNQPGLVRLRRMFGLFAFFYVSLHFITYIWLDQFFDLAEIAKDIVKRPFITVGFLAFVLLIPLAATSNDAVIKRMGAQRWQRLHRLVYVIGILGVVHYWWLVKKDLTQPIIYASVLAMLLAYRIVAARQRKAPAAHIKRA